MSKVLGLSQNQVIDLKKTYGDNIISQEKDVSWVEVFVNQFKSPIIYILVVVSIISYLLGKYIDGSLILIVVVVDVLMGFYQEYNAQKTLVALRGMLKPRAVVIRSGKKIDIEVKDIVPGDHIVLSAGDKVPADGKLIEGLKLLVNEAILTGEEEAVPKNVLGNSKLFMGSIITSGEGIIIAENIGRATEMGKIGQSIEEIEETETPLQVRLNTFAKNLVWFIIIICLVIFVVNILYRHDIWSSLEVSIILAIAAMPAALPIAITIILVLGMKRVLKRNGLVRKLLSIETLGSTSVICTDKTGTLTEGNMQVVKIDTKDFDTLIRVLVLDNEQKSNLEIALWDYAKKSSKLDPQKIYDQYEQIDEEPFDSEKKYSLSINNIDGKHISHLMGAPEKIIDFCAVDEKTKQEILQIIESWADEGLRILGLAYKDEGNLNEKNNYHWLGLIGIQDPIRDKVKEAIIVAQNAGIKIKIVTGDYQKTALRIATNLGFDLKPENIIDGENLEKLSEQELKNRVENLVLFSRVLPHQKLKIVKALQDNGEVVAMTGDGVNDAPALKKSDIGITVGTATEVAKESSDLVLLDNNFKTIIAACEEGRLILANVKKVVGYILSNSFAEIILIFGAMILGFAAPLTVVQILWIQLICDGPPDILLGFETNDKSLMTQTPQEIQREKILSTGMKYLIFAISSTIGILSLIIFWYFEKTAGDLDLARTVVFAIVAAVSLIYVFSFRSLKKSIFNFEGIFTNKYLYLGVGYGFVLIFIAIYLPFFNNLLKTVPLKFTHWLLVLGVAMITIFWIEIVKYLENRKKSVKN